MNVAEMSASEKNSALQNCKRVNISGHIREATEAKMEKNSKIREAAGRAGLADPAQHDGFVHCPDCGSEGFFYCTADEFVQMAQKGGFKASPKGSEDDYEGDIDRQVSIYTFGKDICEDGGIRTEIWDCGGTCGKWLFPVHIQIRSEEKPRTRKIVIGPDGEPTYADEADDNKMSDDA